MEGLKVYAVIAYWSVPDDADYGYENERLEKIFSSEEKAKDWISKQREYYYIMEYEVE